MLAIPSPRLADSVLKSCFIVESDQRSAVHGRPAAYCPSPTFGPSRVRESSHDVRFYGLEEQRDSLKGEMYCCR